MDDQVASFIFIIAAIIIGVGMFSMYSSVWKKGSETKDNWSIFAKSRGGRVLTDERYATIAIAGFDANRDVKIAAFANPNSRFRSVESMEIILKFDNTADIILHTGSKDQLLHTNQRFDLLNLVQSGNVNFDHAYRIRGYPEEAVQEVLKSVQVQSRIKSIKPNSSPLGGHPNIQIEGERLALRVPWIYVDEKKLEGFIQRCCSLADALEEAMDDLPH